MALLLYVYEEDNLCHWLEELQYLEKDILMRMIVTLMTIDHVRIEGILEKEDITREEVEDHQIEKITRVEDIQEEEDPQMMEEPQMMEDPR